MKCAHRFELKYNVIQVNNLGGENMPETSIIWTWVLDNIIPDVVWEIRNFLWHNFWR